MGTFKGIEGVEGFKDVENLDREELIGIIDDFAKNWLAHDGLWFQAVERKYGMEAAIEADTEAWRYFSPIEAKRIKARHNIPEQGGIDGLVKGLGHRLYARLNDQEIIEKTDTSVIFRMCDCRVQSARTRKNMELFPCKSVGIVEYTEFAKAIDARFQTEVISCPPDTFNGEYYCAWKFTLSTDS
ncbi:MAG: hypothetical protein COB67_06250 [SAR324 cluster bacterium]|uniref:4-vinyl reductase 4VR domain-containing protein n=1 Tax=SAR324 cluster bacterium TaxID=2024889 RepID=A0A2A4T4S7_9DELT|nr:MAG: hypothetical protein COB67_06250 [SAR324 cluster bacterium]